MTDEQLIKQIEQLRAQTDPDASQRMRESIDRAWNDRETSENEPADVPVWRLIMKNKITVTTIAAAVLLLILVLPALLPNSGLAKPTWAEIIKPIMEAKTAELTIIIGEEDSGAKIKDQVLGNRIRRTVEGVDSATIIDLETSKILTLDPDTKQAIFIDMENLPKIPNYMEHLRNLLTNLESIPELDIEYLGMQTLDSGADALGMNVNYPGGRLYIAVDPQTYAPVQVDEFNGQLTILCRDIKFDVELDESQFSMEIPEGYTTQQSQLDLNSGTEENFINGLRLWTEWIGDGYFPEDVRVESYIQSAIDIGHKLESSGLSEEEQMEIGMSMASYLLFIRMYRGDGPWTYTGRGVQLDQPDTPIFWYKPHKDEPYHVIYADLHVEKIENEEDLPPAPEPYDAVPAYSPGRAKGLADFTADSENDLWHIQAGGQIEVHSTIQLTLPEEAGSVPITLPYPKAQLTSVLLNDRIIPFTASEDGTYNVPLLADDTARSNAELLFIWTVPLDALEKKGKDYRIELQCLLPTADYKVNSILEENCGYRYMEEYINDPNQIEMQHFSVSGSKPKLNYGSCSLIIEPIK